MSTLKSIEGLLEKPVYMMTGEEYLELTHYALANSPNADRKPWVFTPWLWSLDAPSLRFTR